MKTFWRSIHLYLSLAVGLVIIVVCFTGATLVFEKEFQQSIYPERYFVEPGAERINLDSVLNAFHKQVKSSKVNGVKLFGDPSRSLEVSYTEKDVSKKGVEKRSESNNTEAKSKRPERPRSKQGYVNPYSGALIGLHESRSGFFMTMFSMHRWLLMGDAGKLIVGMSTSVFLFILITGIILWWPATRNKLRQHLTIKWSGWKRINHDLHIVVGFYTAIFLFAFAFTGLAWSFEWFNNGIYWITGTENKRAEPPVSVYRDGLKPISAENIYTSVKRQVPDGLYYQISLPKDSAAAYAVTVMPENATHERASDQYFFDQYTGALVGTNLYEERNLGQRVRSTFYPIHVGSIGGLPGRIIAFISCIAGVTFPITGVIIWINRLKKKRKKARKEQKKRRPESNAKVLLNKEESTLPL